MPALCEIGRRFLVLVALQIVVVVLLVVLVVVVVALLIVVGPLVEVLLVVLLLLGLFNVYVQTHIHVCVIYGAAPFTCDKNYKRGHIHV